MIQPVLFPTDLLGETIEIIERENNQLLGRGVLRAIDRGSDGWAIAIEAVDDSSYSAFYDRNLPGELLFMGLRPDRRVRVVQQCLHCNEILRALSWYTREELKKHEHDHHSPDAVAESERKYQERLAAERRAALIMMSGVDLTDDEKVLAAWLVRQLVDTPSDRHEAMLAAIKYTLSAAARGDT